MVTSIFGFLPTPRCFDLSQFIPSAAGHLVTPALYNQFKEDSSSLDSDKARERDMSQFIVHCSCYESSPMCNVQLQDRSNWHTVTQLRRFSSVTHNHSIFCPHELHSSSPTLLISCIFRSTEMPRPGPRKLLVSPAAVILDNAMCKHTHWRSQFTRQPRQVGSGWRCIRLGVHQIVSEGFAI